MVGPFPTGADSLAPQGYPPQQYLQGGQYAAAGAQYAPSAPQSSTPSPSYPGHRLQQSVGQYLSASGSAGPYYKVPQGNVGKGWRSGCPPCPGANPWRPSSSRSQLTSSMGRAPASAPTAKRPSMG